MMSGMRLRHELHYDATPAEVFEMLADPEFRTKVSQAQDVVSFDLQITPHGEGFSLVNDQVQKSLGLPAFATKFAGDTTRAIQREEWRDTSGGSLAIETPGKPTNMVGSISLADDGEGTLETVEIDILVKVPLLGGKLEKLLHDTIAASIDIEHEVGRAWLAGER